jgi:hypothetical protein
MQFGEPADVSTPPDLVQQSRLPILMLRPLDPYLAAAAVADHAGNFQLEVPRFGIDRDEGGHCEERTCLIFLGASTTLRQDVLRRRCSE